MKARPMDIPEMPEGTIAAITMALASLGHSIWNAARAALRLQLVEKRTEKLEAEQAVAQKEDAKINREILDRLIRIETKIGVNLSNPPSP